MVCVDLGYRCSWVVCVVLCGCSWGWCGLVCWYRCLECVVFSVCLVVCGCCCCCFISGVRLIRFVLGWFGVVL